MGYNYNKAAGYWEAYFCKRHPITKKPVNRRRRALKSEAEAKRAERELIAEVELLLHKAVTPTWSETLEQFLNACRNRGLTEHTIHDYSTSLKAHTMESWGNRSMDEITTTEIRELIKSRVGHRSPSHQKNLRKFINGVFNYAVEEGTLVRNPTPEMHFQTGDKVKKVLTEEQARTLLDKAKVMSWEWYPHWAMAIYTGMRSGELYALSWDKVNIDDRLIKVDSSWNNKDGFKSTKSGDDRIVEIAPNLLPILRQLKLQQSDSHFVLPRIDKWDKGEQARDLRLFLKGIGLPAIRFHDLRATWATLLLTKGVEPIKVMKMGGWKDMKTMMIYVRTAGVDIKGMTDCLDLHDPSSMPAKVINFERNDRGIK
jgi:integrase